MKLRALVIEDHLALAQALASKVEAAGFAVEVVPTLALARKAISKQAPDLVLLDLGLPDGSGLDLVDDWPGESLPLVAIITAHGDLEHAIRARKAGVSEFLVKPVDFRALERFLNLAKTNLAERTESESFSAGFIGSSPAMRRVFQQIAQACASDTPVVIHGPEGSGRSHVARLIHQHAEVEQSLRVVDCSIAETWRLGWELADGAWLVFDEVDQLPMADQVWLAEQLNRNSGTARLMAICGEGGLLSKVRQHQFHPDLYYRLQGIEVELPALAERLEDLPALCALFASERDPMNPIEFDESAMKALSAYPWPRNLSELRALIEELSSSSSDAKIRSTDLVAMLGASSVSAERLDPVSVSLRQWLESQLTSHGDLPDYRELHGAVESRLLALLLEHFDHKPSVMAQALKLNRSTLRRRLRDLGLQ